MILKVKRLSGVKAEGFIDFKEYVQSILHAEQNIFMMKLYKTKLTEVLVENISAYNLHNFSL